MRMCFDEPRKKVVKTEDGGIMVVEDHRVTALAAIELNLPELPHSPQQQALYQKMASMLSYLEFMRKWNMGKVLPRGVDLTVPLEELRKKQREHEILHHKKGGDGHENV